MDGSLPKGSPLYAALQSLALSILYVGSLYICGSPLPRDHPITVKQRFKRVLIVSLIAPILVHNWIDYRDINNGLHSFMLSRWLGLHFRNFIMAALLPLVLTLILFLGPIMLWFFDDISQNQSIGSLKSMKMRIWLSVNDIIWWRTYVVAPFTEEFVFRSCMLPLLVPAFGLYTSVFLCPLFFGVAHVHHAIEGLRIGIKPFTVLIRAAFQISYTTIFGAYSAFLFLRTGHLIGPVICHSFCNLMGFPDFDRISDSEYPKVVGSCFVIGLVSFLLLLFPVTEPAYYASIYWTKN